MIRKAFMSDQGEIMRILRDTIINMESKGIYQWDNVYPNEQVINNDLNKGNMYVYKNDGILQGIIVLNEYQDKEYEDIEWEFNSGRQLIIHRLCVDPQYQGQGVARLLMNFAEQYGKEHKFESIRLDTFMKNGPACRFYEKAGYKKVGMVIFRKGNFYCFEKGLE